MCTQRQLNIDLTQIKDIVGLGVRRASSFMALGVRVSNDEAVTSIRLETNFPYQFMPAELPIDRVREVQGNFRKWIIGNGLRELDQVTAIFSDKIYEIRTLVEYNGRSLDQCAIDQINRFAKRTNVANKLELIAREYQIDSDLRAHMGGLSKARNALTHNMGIVGEQHITDERELRISWIGFDLVIGERRISNAFEPIRVQEGDMINIHCAVRNRIFEIGSPIELAPVDLSEICLTYLVQAEKVTLALRNQLVELGIINLNSAA